MEQHAFRHVEFGGFEDPIFRIEAEHHRLLIEREVEGICLLAHVDSEVLIRAVGEAEAEDDGQVEQSGLVCQLLILSHLHRRYFARVVPLVGDTVLGITRTEDPLVEEAAHIATGRLLDRLNQVQRLYRTVGVVGEVRLDRLVVALIASR